MNSEKLASSIVYTLRQKGFTAYFCGGCVRDKLLGNIPKDYDIVSNATPEEIQRIFPQTVKVGAQFGVVMVRLEGHSFEVATFRKDGEYLDGRRPVSVDFADEVGDALRRDFTINGLFYDPEEQKVIDHVGGQNDIAKRLIRTIGDPQARFGEDHLRLMRAIRFACRLGFTIAQGTWQAICEQASLISSVSNERIRDELVTMLTGPDPGRALVLLHESRLLSFILCEISPSASSVWETILVIFAQGSPIRSVEIAMAILLHAVDDPRKIEAICRRMRFSTKSCELISELTEKRHQFDEVDKLSIASLKRFLRMDHFADHLQLYKLHCLAGNGNIDNYRFCQHKLALFSPQSLRPKPLLKGEDLKQMGFTPGPIFKQILSTIEQEQLEGTIGNKEEAIALVTDQFGSQISSGKEAKIEKNQR